MPEILSHIGNLELLERPKTAFLCSSKTTSRDILKSFDWATSVPKDSCIISFADNVVFGALDPTSSLTNLVEEQKLLGIEIHTSV